ncbi:MAG: hypothetical protein J6331_04865 [Lentisphaeria bacterium]|nr:hypothetical protein [Lentisphaeria bacterium]
MIVTTEKDAVRMPRLDRRDLPIVFLRVEIDILSGRENFDECISRICFNLKPMPDLRSYRDSEEETLEKIPE